MATDFFQRQARARTNTIWLVVLFVLAVVGIVGTTFVLTYAGIQYSSFQLSSPQRSQTQQSVLLAGLAALAALGLIVLGTGYKVISLRAGGGQSVAEAVGGRRLHPNTTDLDERRVLNVVEEMAIASGTPVPPVYLLDEPGINAFAAGYSSSDAIVGITRGAIEELNREQLQGVIAHEFSHILNGDMRMNIRMIGILHGILLISLIGRMLLNILRYSNGGQSRRSRGDGKGDRGGQIILIIIAVGAALTLIGFLGSVFGGLIKAAVSRQREYLADASAVQFTRNPPGIAGALKRLGRSSATSLIRHPNAPGASHMYFARGVFEGFSGWMATHPPLPKRILAIEPNWDGTFTPTSTDPGRRTTASNATTLDPVSAPRAAATTAAFADVQGIETLPVAQVHRAFDSIGAPEQSHRDYAAEMLSQIDPHLIDAAHEPYTARALVFALLMDPEANIRARQISGLSRSIEPHVVVAAQDLYQRIKSLDARARIPLLDMTLPALRSMTMPQYRGFMQSFAELVDADDRHSLFEWVLAQMLIRHLKPQYTKVESPVTWYYSLNGLSEPISVLLSTIARVGHRESSVGPSFEAARGVLSGLAVRQLPAAACTLVALDAALKQLARSSERIRHRLIDASVAAICADNQVKVRELELLRGIADLLDCPVPPLVPTTPASAGNRQS